MVGIVNKPDINYGIWASNGDVAVPSSEKVEIGHIVEKPKKEIVNWIENRQDKFMAYINQVGIAEWDSKTTYKANVSFVNRSGTVYKAKSQNIDKDPTLNQDIWGIAWSTYEDYLSVVSDLEKIKEQEGYLGLYVSKSNPIMEAPSQGVAYGFTDDSDTGLVKDSGGNPSIQKDGVVIASFDHLEEDNSVVRFSDLRKYLEFYKVGDIYITTTQGNPFSILGYGTWVRYGEGRVIVGFSETSSHPDWTKVLNNTFGGYTHTLTVSELASHRHSVSPFDKFTSRASDSGKETQGSGDYNRREDEYSTGAMGTVDWQTATEKATGENQPHNNVQPSIVTFVWMRTS